MNMLKTHINKLKLHTNKLKSHLNKSVVITALSIVSVGLVLFIGGQIGTAKSRENISEAFLKVDKKKPGKYAAQNSEKAKFFAAKKA